MYFLCFIVFSMYTKRCMIYRNDGQGLSRSRGCTLYQC